MFQTGTEADKHVALEDSGVTMYVHSLVGPITSICCSLYEEAADYYYKGLNFGNRQGNFFAERFS